MTNSLALPLLGGLRRALPAPAVLDGLTAVPDHVAVGSTARVLSQVKRRGKNLAIWLRQPKNAAVFDTIKDVHVHVDVHADVAAVAAVVAAALADPVKEVPLALARALVADVRRLAPIAARLDGMRLVRAKVHTCDGDECRQFHVDHVGHRLITTYAGPGTDWLEDDAARRAHLGGRCLEARTVDAVNNAIVADWTRVHRLPRFSVAAFRGGKCVDDATGAIVHRSPPIAGTGIRRLRLVVEAADAAAVDACAA
jgi:hypothetical protein